jgi:hypothetical protein
MLSLGCVKNSESLRTEQNPKDITKIVFSEEVLHPANTTSFLRTDRTDCDPGVIILVATGVRL